MANELENPNTETKPEAKSEQKTNDTASLEARIKALETENGKLKQSVTNASADASEWKKKYVSRDMLVLDGDYWKVEIKYDNDSKKYRYEGSNSFPYSFKKFLRLLEWNI